ncbi:hypothetical protein KDA08_02525 [Candidatus Saccharibacteria bacterium]|nr:hypothetical protein [Candidatus Saccharibacteria bacterium]
MAQILTYISAAEASLYYSEYAEHSAGVQAEALSASFGLVNSFLNPAIKIPYVAPWDGVSQTVDGVAPILKITQARFCQWICQSNNVGYTDELQALYEATAEMLRALQGGELGIPDTTITDAQTGWALASQTCASGVMHILQPDIYLHSYPMSVEIVIDSVSSGLQPYHSTFNSSTYATYKYRFPSISSSYIDTGIKADNQWQYIPDAGVSVMFEGFFSPNESFLLRGVPDTAVNVAEAPRGIIQRQLLRG